MAKSSIYPEIEEIKEDLDSLKTNVVELTKHITANGNFHASEIKEMAMERLSEMRERGREQLKNIERQVKTHPGQALALAFASGIIASYMFGRR